MTQSGRQRIDKWLFFARIIKSRSLAAKLVQAGRARVNGNRIDQAAHLLKPGDILTVSVDRGILVLEVVAPGERRGPADEARTLYVDRSPVPVPKGEAAPNAVAPLRELGSGRPTKRDRRAIDIMMRGRND